MAVVDDDLGTALDSVLVTHGVTTLTESTATTVCTVAVASGSVVGGTLFYTVEANDATDYQARRGHVGFVAVNKGGTLTATAGTPTESVAVSTGTLTAAFTVATGTNAITLKLNAASSLTQTTLRATWQVTVDGGTGTVTPAS